MLFILFLVLLILLLAGGFSGYTWGYPGYSVGGALVLFLIIVLIVWALGGF